MVSHSCYKCNWMAFLHSADFHWSFESCPLALCPLPQPREMPLLISFLDRHSPSVLKVSVLPHLVLTMLFLFGIICKTSQCSYRQPLSPKCPGTRVPAHQILSGENPVTIGLALPPPGVRPSVPAFSSHAGWL